MSAPFASSTAIFFCFLSSFFFTFASARVPFQLHFHRTNSNSLSNTHNSHPNQNQWQPKSSKPKPQSLHSTTHPSKPLPFTLFSSDPRIPRHPLPLSSRLDSWKPRQRAQDFDPLPRGGVRHVARGWTRFGVVEPTLFRHRDMGTEKRLSHRHQHINDAHTGLVKRIRKFLNRF